tara:strand:- start:2353 stop:3402 length:1050 start_codon:yes stop_codon:yes gene_type:complete
MNFYQKKKQLQNQSLKDKFDRPLKDLRISVIDKCNFRCPYCMPAELYGHKYKFIEKNQLLTFEEITRLVSIMVDFGVSKIRLTGGEPLLRKNIVDLVSQLRTIQGIDDLSLTTNGYLLNIALAEKLKNAGLQRITVSLDSLDEKIFKKMNGRGIGPDNVIQGIKAISHVGLSPIKINCVVKKGLNDNSFLEVAKFCKSNGYIARFIEFMDVGTLNKWKLDDVVSAKEIVEKINEIMPLKKIDSNYSGEVASRYQYLDGEGEIGIISSVTKPFCGECTRMRLSPEGKIITCLFSNTGFDLKGPMRDGVSDKELRELICEIWNLREDRYSEERALMTKPRTEKIEMHHIGG